MTGRDEGVIEMGRKKKRLGGREQSKWIVHLCETVKEQDSSIKKVSANVKAFNITLETQA